MANSATALGEISVNIRGMKVTMVRVVIDTVPADLIVYSPAAGNHAAIVGWQYAAPNAHVLTVKSGANVLTAFNMPDTSGRDCPLNPAPVLVTQQGEDLVFNSTVAIPYQLLYIAEYNEVYLSMQ